MLKWIIYSVGGTFLLLLIAALIIFRQDLYEYSINPRTPFEVMRPPPAPKYENRDAWAAYPDDTATKQAAKQADVFFVHTTTYFSSRGWNGIVGGEAKRRVDNYLIPGQAALFGDIANLYAPYYRQATLYTFFTRSMDSSRARAFAYRDVARAFEVFLAQRQPDRPFFVVGHGQGAVHAVRLLADFVAPNDSLRAQLVAAYLTGATVPEKLFDAALAPLKPCDEPQQTGCVAAWVTFRDGTEPDEFLKHALYWQGDELRGAQYESLLCVNPLTWTRSERVASATVNIGARPLQKNKKAPLGELVPNAAGAQCRNGVLVVDNPSLGTLRKSIFQGDRPNHLADFNLLFQNVQRNALDRLQAMLNRRPEPGKNGEIY